MSAVTNTERGEGPRIVWTIARRLVMVVVLIIAFVLSAVITIYLIFRTGATRVPSIVGKSQVEAQSLAEKAGLRVKVQLRPDPTVPKNQVIETRPVPNSSVKKDSTVVIVVSSGPAARIGILKSPDFVFPDFSGPGRSELPPQFDGAIALTSVATDRVLASLLSPDLVGRSL